MVGDDVQGAHVGKKNVGDTAAVVGFGVAAARSGNLAEAEVWYRAAADSGDVDGMNLLALLREERGGFAEASRWYARAARTGTGRNGAGALGCSLGCHGRPHGS